MIKIRRFLLLPVLAGLLCSLSPASLMGAWGSSLLSRTQQNFQNFRKSASRLLHNPYVQAGIGIGVATVTRWALLSHVQNTSRARSDFFAGQLYRPFNPYDHPTTSSFPQKSQSGTIGTGYVSNPSPQIITRPVQSDDNDKILNDALSDFDALQHQPSQQPLIQDYSEPIPLSQPLTQIQKSATQDSMPLVPQTFPNSFLGAPSESPIIQQPYFEEQFLVSHQNQDDSLRDISSAHQNKSIRNPEHKEYDVAVRLQNFCSKMSATECPGCSKRPHKQDRLNACSIIRQRILDFTKQYSSQLNEARDNSTGVVPKEAHDIYNTFVFQNDGYQDSETFKKYAPGYNHGLQLLQSIEAGNTDVIKTSDDLTDIMIFLYIGSCRRRQVPLGATNYTLVGSEKFAPEPFHRSGLMVIARLPNGKPAGTHYTQYEATDHYRISGKEKYFLPASHREILGGTLITKKSTPPYAPGFAKSRTYLKPEEHPLNGSLIDYGNHALSVPSSQIRRIPILRHIAGLTTKTINYSAKLLGIKNDIIKAPRNDYAYWAKEHSTTKITKNFQEILEKLHHKESPYNQNKHQELIHDVKIWNFMCMKPLLDALAQQKNISCQKECAGNLQQLLELIFEDEGCDLIQYKQGFEVTFDLSKIDQEQPL